MSAGEVIRYQRLPDNQEKQSHGAPSDVVTTDPVRSSRRRKQTIPTAVTALDDGRILALHPRPAVGTHERVLPGAGQPTSGGQAVRFSLRGAEARGCTLDAVRAGRCPAHAGADHPALAEEPVSRHEQRASAQRVELFKFVDVGASRGEVGAGTEQVIAMQRGNQAD